MRTPSWISIALTWELYLSDALCLAANSRTWATSLNLMIRFTTHFNRPCFLLHQTGIVATRECQSPYIAWRSPCIPWWIEFPWWWSVRWYGMTIISHGANSSYKPLASSSFFLSPFIITLLVDFAYPLAYWCARDENFIRTPKYMQRSMTIVVVNWVPLSEMITPGSPYLHIIFCQ